MAEGRAEKIFAQADDNGLGAAVMAVASLLEAAPFGGPMAATLQAVYQMTSQARTNGENCRKLLRVALVCCDILGAAPEDVRQRNASAVAELQAVLSDVRQLIANFGPSSFFRRILAGERDRAAFEDLSSRLSTWIQASSLHDRLDVNRHTHL